MALHSASMLTKVAGLAIVLTVAAMPFSRSGAHADTPGQRISQDLRSLSQGTGDWRLLIVTYDDLHAFHGGLRLSIHGDGIVDQEALRVSVGRPRPVDRQGLAALIGLLITEEAWEQRVPERQAVPDESRAKLIITYGDDRSMIWEWYNEMTQIGRISKIRNLMEQIAWQDHRQ